MGAEKKVVFQILRGNKTLKMPVELKVAPRDFETAERMKDDTLGITLKDLTYEVRHFHKVPGETPGVVVSKVESGSRAQVAKLEPLSIITRVNDIPVRDVSEFKKLLLIGGNLTLTTISYGQTKLVELTRE